MAKVVMICFQRFMRQEYSGLVQRDHLSFRFEIIYFPCLFSFWFFVLENR